MADPIAGTIVSIGTGGWWVDASGAATGQPSLAAGTAGAATATLVLTPPVDAGYARSDVLLIADGAAAWTVLSSYHVAGDPAGGAPFAVASGMWYTAQAIAFEATGLRSLPSLPVRFLTPYGDGGAVNLMFGFRTDKAAADEVTDNLDVSVEYHREPLQQRGTTGRYRLSGSFIYQQVRCNSLVLAGETLGRRRD